MFGLNDQFNNGPRMHSPLETGPATQETITVTYSIRKIDYACTNWDMIKEVLAVVTFLVLIK